MPPGNPIERPFSEAIVPEYSDVTPSDKVSAVTSPLTDAEFTPVNDPPLKDAVPSVRLEERSSFSRDKVPEESDAVPSVRVEAVRRPLKERALAPVSDPAFSEAVPSETVAAVNNPLSENALTLVRDPETSDAVPSVIVVELKSFSGDSVPPFNDDTLSVTVPAVIRPLIDMALALVSNPELSDAVPSVTVAEMSSFSGDKVPEASDEIPSV